MPARDDKFLSSAPIYSLSLSHSLTYFPLPPSLPASLSHFLSLSLSRPLLSHNKLSQVQEETFARDGATVKLRINNV